MILVALMMTLTFIITTVNFAILVWVACQRVSRHLQGNPEAVQALAEHVMPALFGCKAGASGVAIGKEVSNREPSA